MSDSQAGQLDKHAAQRGITAKPTSGAASVGFEFPWACSPPTHKDESAFLAPIDSKRVKRDFRGSVIPAVDDHAGVRESPVLNGTTFTLRLLPMDAMRPGEIAAHDSQNNPCGRPKREVASTHTSTVKALRTVSSVADNKDLKIASTSTQ